VNIDYRSGDSVFLIPNARVLSMEGAWVHLEMAVPDGLSRRWLDFGNVIWFSVLDP
jgi:hypothetical protein